MGELIKSRHIELYLRYGNIPDCSYFDKYVQDNKIKVERFTAFVWSEIEIKNVEIKFFCLCSNVSKTNIEWLKQLEKRFFQKILKKI